MGGWYSAPDIAADPSDTGILVAAQPGITPVTAATYAVTSGSVTQLARVLQLVTTTTDDGVAVYPGGAQILLCNNTYSTSTLGQEPGGGPVSAYVAANAVSADGSLVALAGWEANSEINVYRPAAAPVNQFSLSGEVAWPAAFSADDSELYAVTETTIADGLRAQHHRRPGLTTRPHLSGPSSQ